MLPFLNEQERDEIANHLDHIDIPLWQPHEDNQPQQDAYDSEADVLGYGGAAGGGKTDLLLGLAYTKHIRTRLFRRLFTDLDDLVQRGDEIQDGNCTFVWGLKKRWETQDNRVVSLGAIQHEKDLKKYKGRPSDLIGFDEAVDFPEHFVRFISGWLRTTIPGQRTRIVLTFNPPTTPEGEWIVQYFGAWLDPNHPKPAEAGELRWYVRIDDKDVEVDSNEPVEHEGELYHPQSRTFIPARVEDNPFLADDGQYIKQLNSLPEPLRSQLRYGDFTVGAKDHEWQVIPTAWVVAAQARGQEQEKPDVECRAMGVDPSRGGDDVFVIMKLYGNYFDVPIVHSGVDSSDGIIGAKHVTDAMGDENPPIWLDAIAIGSSVYDQLKVLDNITVHPVNVGTASSMADKSGRYKMFNLRSAQMWSLREALDPNSGENIALPPDRQIRIDLTAPRYMISSGKIKVELKADTKKRIHRSPDYGDALVLAWHGVANNLVIEFFNF